MEIGASVKVGRFQGVILLHAVGEELDGVQILLHDGGDILVATASITEIIFHAAEEGNNDHKEEVLPRLGKGIQKQVAVLEGADSLIGHGEGEQGCHASH